LPHNPVTRQSLPGAARKLARPMAYSARLSLAANLVLVLALASPALAATERTHSTPHCAGIEPEECQLFGWQPPVNLTPITSDRRSVPFVYARVITPRAPVYRHPADAGAGSLPARTLGAGFIDVSVTAQPEGSAGGVEKKTPLNEEGLTNSRSLAAMNSPRLI